MSNQPRSLEVAPTGAGSFLRLRARMPSMRGITARHGRPTTPSTWSALRNVLLKKSISIAAAVPNNAPTAAAPIKIKYVRGPSERAGGSASETKYALGPRLW